MKEFQKFLAEGKVKRISPDSELAAALLKNVAEREKSVFRLKAPEFPLLIFENIYDCLRELLDALLALDGYKSYSHEAAISYLKRYNASEIPLLELDRFRVKRNNSKYYGEPISLSDAQEIRQFYDKHKKILINIINKRQT